MDKFTNLEVTITYEKDQYEAVCDTFPKCSGAGETKEIALQKLSDSIGQHISNLAKNAMKTMFQSDRYTEVLLDMSKNKKTHKMVFNLDASLLSFTKLTKSLYVKVPGTKTKPKKIVQDIQPLFEKLPQHINMTDHMIIDVDDDDDDEKLELETEQEGFVFGFPVSFN